MMDQVLLERPLSLPIRLRRNRKSEAIRTLVRETHLHASDLIAPLFLIDGHKQKVPIASLPGIERLTLDYALEEASALHAQGIQAIALFPVLKPSLRSSLADEAWNEEGLLPQAIRAFKTHLPTLCIIADVALDPYTSHGHDGLVNQSGTILNDETVECLIRMALVQAKAGVDII
ncbi:MAG TPA: porphobilinogen synthase, partial [Chlamydiales bacterium]|nr:porphobilinogen synthase [Chlamydiales bacterium]